MISLKILQNGHTNHATFRRGLAPLEEVQDKKEAARGAILALGVSLGVFNSVNVGSDFNFERMIFVKVIWSLWL